MSNLSEKAIKIKGKDYVLVSDRIIEFNQVCPQGSITTEIITPLDADTVIVKATIRPVADGLRVFVAHSQATWGEGYINASSALENAETSAVGRALGFMGIGVLDSVASVDEINKANSVRPRTIPTSQAKQKQQNYNEILALCSEIDPTLDTKNFEKVKEFVKKQTLCDLTNEKSEEIIDKLKIIIGDIS